MSTTQHISDDVVDAIEIHWNTDPNHLVTKVTSDGDVPSVLSGFLTLSSWTFVPFWAEGAAVRGDRSANESGFRFPEGLDSDEEPFEGVLVYDYFNRIVLSEPAFSRMMSRLFQTLRDGAEAHDDPVRDQAWWPRFESWADRVAERAAAEVD